MKPDLLPVSRRDLLLGLAGTALAAAGTRGNIYNPELVVHTSLWLGEAEFRHKALPDILEEAFASIARAGYQRVELVAEFLAPGLRESSLAQLKKRRLEPCIVAADGPVHEREAGELSRARVRELARLMQGQGTRYVNFTAAPRPDGRPKSSEEFDTQAYQLNRMGQELREAGLGLLLHHTAAEMRDDAREWRFCMAHTETGVVSFCLDVATAVAAGMKPLRLIEEADTRLRSLHLRNPRKGVQQERLREGDIDLEEIAALLRHMMYNGFLVVELLYGKDTERQRPLVTDLSLSRWYMQEVFGSRPGSLPVDMGPHVRVRS